MPEENDDDIGSAADDADYLARALVAIGDAHDHTNDIRDDAVRWALRDVLAGMQHLIAALDDRRHDPEPRGRPRCSP